MNAYWAWNSENVFLMTSGRGSEKAMNEPNVQMERNDIIDVWVQQRATGHDKGEKQGRQQEQRRAHRGPRPPTEARDGEGVGDAKDRADQVRNQREQEELGHRQLDADVGKIEDDDRPYHPHAESEVLGEHREREVLAGDLLAPSRPEQLVVRPPVIDPPAPPPGCGRDGGRRRRGLSREM